MDGEWWRAVTALTLHGGLSHIAGNLVFGVMFAVLASHSLGVGLTSVLIGINKRYKMQGAGIRITGIDLPSSD